MITHPSQPRKEHWMLMALCRRQVQHIWKWSANPICGQIPLQFRVHLLRHLHLHLQLRLRNSFKMKSNLHILYHVPIYMSHLFVISHKGCLLRHSQGSGVPEHFARQAFNIVSLLLIERLLSKTITYHCLGCSHLHCLALAFLSDGYD